MANMFYCRFENTYNDLMDCYNHIDDKYLSIQEKQFKEKLLKLCQEIINYVDSTPYSVEDEE